MSVVCLLIGWATGWLAVRLARPAGGPKPGWAGVAFEVSLGAAAAVVIGGVEFFLLRILGLASAGVLTFTAL